MPDTAEKTKFTPGPWRANSVSMHDDSIGVSIERVVIASVHNAVSAFDPAATTQWANAYLIAAAPDLHEQTRLLVETLKDLIRVALSEGDTEGAALRGYSLLWAEAALSKAEGR